MARTRIKLSDLPDATAERLRASWHEALGILGQSDATDEEKRDRMHELFGDTTHWFLRPGEDTYPRWLQGHGPHRPVASAEWQAGHDGPSFPQLRQDLIEPDGARRGARLVCQRADPTTDPVAARLLRGYSEEATVLYSHLLKDHMSARPELPRDGTELRLLDDQGTLHGYSVLRADERILIVQPLLL